MNYELWDTETGNLVEAFEDQSSALRAARELIALNAEVYPEMLTLLAVDARGGLATVAASDALAVLANSDSDGDVRRSG
jgi:hypothetical protein